MADFDIQRKFQNQPSPKINSHSGMPATRRLDLTTAGMQKKKRKWPKLMLGFFVVLVLVFGSLVVGRAINLSNKVFVGQKTTFFQKLKGVFSGGGVQLQGEQHGQINILLLGIGGEGHDGPFLSDTMILAQIRPSAGEISMISIPRDYLVQLPEGYGERKINSAFAEGYYKKKDWDEGGKWARQVVEKMSGLSIPYFAVVDFAGFERAVDEVGGLDVHIDRTFTDYSYPDDGIGYLPPITFTEGDETMNGRRALQFARSRHAAFPEGSDFARSQRQQKIIQAFKNKVFGLNFISDSGTINKLLGVFADHFHTNMGPGEIFHLYSITKEKNLTVLSLSLDPDTSLVCDQILESNGAYVLVPCPGKSLEDIENFFKNSFAIAKLKEEGSIVWLASSTGNRDAYRTAFRKLTNAGLIVYELPYSKDNLPSTLVYQVNPKPATLEFIQNQLKATLVNLPPPGVKLPKERVDAVVILGTNAVIEPEPKPYIAPPARKPTTTPEAATSTATSTPLSTSTKPTTASSTKTTTATTTPAKKK